VSSSRKRGPTPSVVGDAEGVGDLRKQLAKKTMACGYGLPDFAGTTGVLVAPPYFFFTTFGFGSGFSACGSKPI
jgi:hypothetical protein